MRKFLGWLSILAWVALCLRIGGAVQGHNKTTPPKKTTSKTSRRSPTGKAVAKAKTRSKSAPRKVSASKAGAKSAGKKTSKSGKKAAPRTSWRNRQTTPTPQRYKQIQDALVAKGFLSPEDASGAWGQSSSDALKKFQAAQNIESTGKIDSLSLIALGLGPKHDDAIPAKPPETPPQAP
jgi:cytoskeletal protein RodZ